MKRLKFQLIIMSTCVVFFILGCGKSKTVIVESPSPTYTPPVKQGPPPWAPAHGYRAKHRYFYYPSSSVYYDTGRNLYFYLEADNWRIGASLPTGVRIDTSDYVALEMDTDTPYEFHSEVIKRYPPGQLKKKEKKRKKK